MFPVKPEDAPTTSSSSEEKTGEIQAPRGFPDLLPEDHRFFTFVKKIVRHRCRQAGFQRITTPMLENAELFARGVGESSDIVSKEMFTLEDRKGRTLALRPEGTAGVVRAFLERRLFAQPQPVKLFYFDPAFRYERPQAGRFRQHWQFGAEVLGGENDPVVDAQVIELGFQVLTDLGIADAGKFHINSIGCPACRPKFRKALVAHFESRKRNLCEDCLSRLEKNPLRLLDCKNEDCRILAADAPEPKDFLCEDCADHFTKLKEYLETLAIPFEENPRLVRGLDYYTKTVFEFIPADGGGTLCGGGRYDGLAELLGGNATPGVGFGIGIERVSLEMKKKGLQPPDKDRVQVFVALLGDDAKKKGLPLISALRRAGLRTRASLGQSSLKAQLKQADRLGAEWAVILGEFEVEQETAILRDLRIGDQQTTPFEKVEETLLKVFPEGDLDTFEPGEIELVEEKEEEPED